MKTEVIIIGIYLIVIMIIIGIFISKNIKQRREIQSRIDKLEREEDIYLGLGRRRYR